MNILRLLIVAALPLCLPVICAAQVDDIKPTFDVSRSYLRSTIKSLPAAAGRPLLHYLDAGRVAADEGMRLFAAGKTDALYESMAADFKGRSSLEQFRRLAQAFEQSAGQIVSYEYRNQALAYPPDNSPPSGLTKAGSHVYYAVKAARLSGEGGFVKVRTVRAGGRHVVSFINFLNYGDNIPPWLLRPDAPVTRN